MACPTVKNNRLFIEKQMKKKKRAWVLSLYFICDADELSKIV